MSLGKSSEFEVSQSNRQFKGRILWKMLPLFMLLSLIPMFLMGGLAYQRARNLLLQQITSQLVTLDANEIADLENWTRNKGVRLNSVASSPTFRTVAEEFIEAAPNSNEYTQAFEAVSEQIDLLNPSITSTLFNEVLFINSNGTIVFSTEERWENLQLNDSYLFNTKIANNSSNNFFIFSPEPLYEAQDEFMFEQQFEVDNEVIHVSFLSVAGLDNSLIGYLVGITNSNSIQITLENSTQFLPNSSVYIITEEREYLGVTKLYGLAKVEPSNAQLTLEDSGPYLNETVASVYESYDGLPVVGLYNYHSGLNIGLMVEVPQANVFSQINALGPFFLTLIVIVGTLALGLVVFTIRRFTNPILEIAHATEFFAKGDWQYRAPVTRNDEIGLLANSFNEMADQLFNLYQSMEHEVREQTQQIVAAAEIGHLATSANNLNDLLNRAVNLMVERFDFYHAAIFLLDEARENAYLAEATGNVGRNLKAKNYQIALSTASIVAWVANNNKPHVASDVSEDSLHLRHEMLPQTHSEVGLPLSIGNNVLGVLDIQSADPIAFTQQTVEVLNTLANQIASAIQNFRLVEGASVDLQQTSQLYLAGRRVSRAEYPEDILKAVAVGIQNTSFYGAVYIPKGNHLELLENEEAPPLYNPNLPGALNVSMAQAASYFSGNAPIIIRDTYQPAASLHSELLSMPRALNCVSAAIIPIPHDNKITALIIIASSERGQITEASVQPIAGLAEQAGTALDKLSALETTQASLEELQLINNFSQTIGNETDLDILYDAIHNEIKRLIGDLAFFIGIYDPATDHIELPYLYENDAAIKVDPFPLGEGLSSVVVRTKQPLMLVENTEARARALGAKIVGQSAKSWLGVPLIAAGEIIGLMAIQDLENEFRFTESDLRIMSTLASQIAGVIRSGRLLEESQRRARQLQTAAEIARETSGTLSMDQLLVHAITLVQEQFDFYHASVFLLDKSGQYAVVQESTGEAGRQMKIEGHRLEVGSQSIIGTVTATGEPLVVNDVTADPTHRFNPLLPDTRAELGIPMTIGQRVLGALDVQSTIPFSFSPDDIEVLQILADQLAVAVVNAELFTEAQDHLAQHRLIHHVTTVAASSSNLEDALSSTVQGLRVTLGDRVAILLLDHQENILRVAASAGYEDDILGLQIEVGVGVTGWVAEHREPLLVNDVTQDERYIAGDDTVRSEVAVPLVYRGELLGVLNVESDEISAFNEQDRDILATLAGSLGAIIVNTRLAERQRQLFDITDKIRRSVSMETILQTTASELSKALQARKARIQVGGASVGVAPLTDTTTGFMPDLPPTNGATTNGAEQEENQYES